jgi:hypothetical protein
MFAGAFLGAARRKRTGGLSITRQPLASISTACQVSIPRSRYTRPAAICGWWRGSGALLHTDWPDQGRCRETAHPAAGRLPGRLLRQHWTTVLMTRLSSSPRLAIALTAALLALLGIGLFVAGGFAADEDKGVLADLISRALSTLRQATFQSAESTARSHPTLRFGISRLPTAMASPLLRHGQYSRIQTRQITPC